MSGSGSGSGSGSSSGSGASQTNDELSVILGTHTLGAGGGGDLLFGSEQDDIIAGGGGNDLIVGTGGNDTLTGGAGEDALFGDYFDDWYDFSDGSGSASGSAANAGGSGSGTPTSFDDYLSGGAGNDLLVGGMGNDELRGGDGDDVLYGDVYGGGESNYTWGAGWEDPRFDARTGSGSGSGSYSFDDILAGGAGNDVLLGQLGDDELYGGTGNDTLFGGAGNDTLRGGNQPGESEAVTLLSENFDSNDGGFSYADNAFRGANNGAYASGSYNGGAGEIGVTLGGINGNDITDGMSGGFSKTINVSADTTSTELTFSYRLTMANQFESDEYGEVLVSIDGQLYGLDGNDYVHRINDGGDSGWQTVTIDVGDLSAGAHTITLGGFLNKKTTESEVAEIKFSDIEIGGAQVAAADTGDDALAGGAGEDDLAGGAGNDTLDGGADNDTIDGGDGDDTITGGAGNDTIDGGAGDDTIYGGSGAGGGSGGASGSYSEIVMGHGPVGYWRLGDANTSELTDSSGNDHHGSYIGSVEVGEDGAVSGDSDTSAYFDGSNEYGLIAPDSDFADLETGTIQMWIKPESLGGNQTFFSSDQSGNSEDGHLTMYFEGSTLKVRYQYEDGTVSNDERFLEVNGVSEGEWHNISLTWDGSQMKLYVDGQLADTGDATNWSFNDGNNPIAIGASIWGDTGRDGNTFDNEFNGRIDEVAILDKALSSGEVDTLANADGTPSAGGDDAADTIDGGAGNDTIFGEAGDDVIDGGDGNDVIEGGHGADTIDGGAGNDIIYGGAQGESGSQTVTVVSENFDDDDGGFTYADGAFRGTSNPDYESGSYSSGDGEISVMLGGIDDAYDITDGMSGGFSKTFTVDDTSSGTELTFSYRLQMSGEFESDEYAEVLVSIDGQLYGLSGNDYVVREAGDGGGGSDYDSGWVTVTIDVGELSAGEHTVTLGGFLNKKTYHDEDAEISFTSVEISGTQSTPPDESGDTIFGGAGEDTIDAGGGNDIIDGGAGTDTVDGGAGDDQATFVVGQTDGTDFYDGGEGTDTLTISMTQAQFDDADINSDLHALKAFIENNSNAATDSGPQQTFSNLGLRVQDMESVRFVVDGQEVALTQPLFTENADTIDFHNVTAGEYEDGTQYDALDGDDHVTLAGNAYEANQAGFDPNQTFHAGAGNDTVQGRNLDDRIDGGAGNDTLDGAGGNDIIDGGDGDDIITASWGNDTLRGDAGNDNISSGDGDDVLEGGAGNDTLNGGTGHDNLDGGDGDDSLTGGHGNDTLAGGAGNDTLDGGTGHDALDGGDGDDILTAGDGNDTLEGGAGNDTLNAGTGNDILSGGDGDDILRGEANNDTLDGGAGNDFLDGGQSDDILRGGAGNDILYGGDGNDTIDGEEGDDLAVFVVNETGGGTEFFDGGTGGDTLVIAMTQAQFDNPGINDDLYALRAFIRNNADSGTDSGAQETFSNLRLTVQDWEDVKFFVDGQEVTLPEIGLFTENPDEVDFDNVVEGQYVAGTQYDAMDLDDTVFMASSLAEAEEAGFDPTVAFHGGTGNDTLTGRGLNDILYGDAGDDILTGGAGNDTLVGGEGNDEITGGTGLQDSLSGGAGNDTISDEDGVLEALGGSGNDTISITFDGAWDNDDDPNTDPLSFNRISGGTGSDVITVTMASLGFLIAINADEAEATNDDGNDRVTLEGLYSTSLVNLGGGNDVFIGGNGNDIVLGGLGNDDIRGGRGNDILFGEDGDDRLRGQGGNDALYGGAGVDRLQGHSGNDILDGGEGADRLEGGGGNDILIFDPGAAVEIDGVTVFSVEDTLVSGGSGTDTLQGSNNGDLIDFNNTAFRTDIEIIRAGGGDDQIIGRLDTTLADQFQVFAGDGDDLVSFFNVTTSNFDLSALSGTFNASSNVWTVDYSGASGQTLTQNQLVGFDPSSGSVSTLFPNANFLGANIIDGGAGKNTLFGSEGSDIIFGGINTNDPSPTADFDDHIYANGGNDILVGGGGYDVYYIARDGGDNFIFDGSTAVGGFSNGLVLFEGFEGNDNVTIDYEDSQGNDNGVEAADVQFVNNQDGTWTISFVGSEGSVTFAGHEISEIELQDHTAGVTSPARVKYTFNDGGTANDFSDDTYT